MISRAGTQGIAFNQPSVELKPITYLQRYTLLASFNQPSVELKHHQAEVFLIARRF